MKYVKPQSELNEFKISDVITTSGGDEPIVTHPNWED